MNESAQPRQPIPVDAGDMTAFERGVIDRLDLILAELRLMRALEQARDCANVSFR